MVLVYDKIGGRVILKLDSDMDLFLFLGGRRYYSCLSVHTTSSLCFHEAHHIVGISLYIAKSRNMTVKRRNHGRNKHGRGHVNRVR